MISTPPTRRTRTTFHTLCAIAVLWIIAFSLAAHLSHAITPRGERSVSIVESVLGEGRMLLGNHFYQRADDYHHRGITGHHHDDDGHAPGCLDYLRAQVQPAEHLHAETPHEVAEIMPWLELSMRVDPGNPESALVAVYWLSSVLKRLDLAEEVLRRAQQNNPLSYAVQLEKARLCLHTGRQDEALSALNATLRLWHTGAANPPDPEDIQAKAEALSFRALLLETKNRNEEAIRDYQAVIAIAPDRHAPSLRLKALAQGIPPDPPAAQLLGRLKNLVEQNGNPAHKPACEHFQ